MIVNIQQGLKAPPPPLITRGTPPSPQPKTAGVPADANGPSLEMYLLLPPMETAAISLRSLYAAINKQLTDE